MLFLAIVLITLAASLNFVTMASGNYTGINVTSWLLLAIGFAILRFRFIKTVK